MLDKDRCAKIEGVPASGSANLVAVDNFAVLRPRVGAAGKSHLVAPFNHALENLFDLYFRASGERVRQVLPIDRKDSQGRMIRWLRTLVGVTGQIHLPELNGTGSGISTTQAP